MGRSTTPTFRLEVQTDNPAVYITSMAWAVRSATQLVPQGLPTVENLRRWVADFEQSCRNGCNAHIGPTTITRAKIVRQATGEVVAEWTPAA